jgi:hypothetical protein
MMVAERARMNTYAQTTRRRRPGLSNCGARSARIAAIPPAPTPATKPVTASPAKADTGGADEVREDQSLTRISGGS